MQDEGQVGIWALHQAARGGNIGMVERLLESGEDVNEPDRWGMTPLHYACGDISVRSLLHKEEGADTVMLRIAKLLIAKGAVVNLANSNGEMPLHNVRDFSVLQILLAEGAEVNAVDVEGRTSLHNGFRVHDDEAVKYLIEAGADVNAADEYGQMPLHSQYGLEAIKLLVAAGANVNAADMSGKTALHLYISHAAWNFSSDGSDMAPIRELIEAGADVNAADDEGRTALHLTEKKSVARLLVREGADISAVDNNGRTAFYHAALLGNIKLATAIFKMGAVAGGWAPCYDSEDKSPNVESKEDSDSDSGGGSVWDNVFGNPTNPTYYYDAEYVPTYSDSD